MTATRKHSPTTAGRMPIDSTQGRRRRVPPDPRSRARNNPESPRTVRGIYVADRKGNYMPAIEDKVLDAARTILFRRIRRTQVLTSPDATRQFLKLHFTNKEHEVFTVMFLTNRHRIIAVEDMFRGTIDGASVHPREVVKAALRHNAAAVIFAHNHPSGDAMPSHADRAITNRLRDSLSLIDVRLLDHFVVGDSEVQSFAEEGLL